MAIIKQNIQMVPVAEIHILNPRTRNKETYDEIKRNIKAVGLKRPITVTLSENKTDGKTYDVNNIGGTASANALAEALTVETWDNLTEGQQVDHCANYPSSGRPFNTQNNNNIE